ncbi:MAG: DUF488 domain-containing protein [Nitrospirae bacterium]|nr:DUF488 domain-containing protein [Nitrospirota bacterium]
MELHLYTAQIGKYKGQDSFDITVKSGDHTFAPTWDIVQGWKSNQIDWETFSKHYRQLMLDSYKRNQTAWNDILNRGTLTFLCYCRAGEHCHRYLLAEFLCKLGEREGISVIYEGERPLPEKSEAEITDETPTSQIALF